MKMKNWYLLPTLFLLLGACGSDPTVYQMHIQNVLSYVTTENQTLVGYDLLVLPLEEEKTTLLNADFLLKVGEEEYQSEGFLDSIEYVGLDLKVSAYTVTDCIEMPAFTDNITIPAVQLIFSLEIDGINNATLFYKGELITYLE